jgi:hypothetical protein
MTLEAVHAAQEAAKASIIHAYHALIMTVRDNDVALKALSELASAALESQLLDQIELDLIANGKAPSTANISRLSIAEAQAAKGWPPCPCGGVIDMDDELVCADCRAAIGA